jgi:aryl-alcohol dehydrogenase-like predicted oxidoreductase
MIARSQAIKLKQGAARGTNQGLGMVPFPPWRTWRFCFSLEAMKRNRLGRTGIVVTDICMGTMTFGLQADEKTSFAMMDRAIEAGIDFFDTAEMYPVPPSAELFGVTEQIVGKWLKGRTRGEIIIASKVTGPGHGWFRPPIRGGFTALDRRQIFQACEDSLRRLRTDYIDLYQTHWPDHGMAQDETLGALTDLIDQGKIRAWGSSNETCWGVMKNLWEAEKNGLARMASVQNNFSLINRRCESELAQVCRKENVSLLPYSPLGGGVLCGKYNEGARPVGARFTDYLQNGGPRQKRMANRFVNERTLETTARLKVIADDLGMSVTTLAVAWSKQHDFVASTIIGATTVAQLEESLLAAEVVLDAETLHRIDEIDEAIPNPMTEDGLRRL